MQISFMEKMVPPILQEIKVLTMRKIRKDGRVPKIGETLYHCTGARTSNYKRIWPKGEEPKCTGVWPVEIYRDGKPIIIDTIFLPEILGYRYRTVRVWPYLSNNCDYIVDGFAKMDGWNAPAEMFDFLEETYGFPFTGNIIYWGKR